ncbi:hypothetical protein NT03LS_3396, partial [Listeria seeligeri FSL N1-067]
MSTIVSVVGTSGARSLKSNPSLVNSSTHLLVDL